MKACCVGHGVDVVDCCDACERPIGLGDRVVWDHKARKVYCSEACAAPLPEMGDDEALELLGEWEDPRMSVSEAMDILFPRRLVLSDAETNFGCW